jgi:hypothetical protein
LCLELESNLPASWDTDYYSAQSDHNYSIVPQHQNLVHYYFFMVAVVQSEKSGSWGVESVTGKFEILDP